MYYACDISNDFNFWEHFEHTNTNKRAGWNKRAGGNFFLKSINVQTQIRPCRGEFCLKINKRACTSIRYTRVNQGRGDYCQQIGLSPLNFKMFCRPCDFDVSMSLLVTLQIIAQGHNKKWLTLFNKDRRKRKQGKYFFGKSSGGYFLNKVKIRFYKFN